MEDTKIVELYWKRDEKAIIKTKEKYGALCYTVAANLLNVKEDAEECVNDTYLAAWNAMPVQKPKKLQAWLCRVVRNIAVDRWRKNHTLKRNREMEVLLDELEECASASGQVEDEIDAIELGRIIDEWLHTLPEEDRILFVRRYFNGEGIASLAGEYRMPPAVLTQKLYKLRRLLKGKLKKEGIFI